MSEKIDLSREAVEEMCLRFDHNVLSRPDCTSMLRALLDRAERAEADAVRYRWLRDNRIRDLGEEGDCHLNFRFNHLFRETLDEAVDRERELQNNRVTATRDREQGERGKV